MNMNTRGSEWGKWDLHFHTPSSYDYKDSSVSNQEIIDILYENNVVAVAITDHHTIDVDRIKELQQMGAERGITVFPGIELRSELGGSDTVHFIGIFPENCDLGDIWIKLQSELGITEADVKRKGNDHVYCDLKDSTDMIHQLGGLTTIHAGKKSNTIENIRGNKAYKLQIKTDILIENIDILDIGNPLVDIEGYRNIVFPSIGMQLPMIICSDNHDIKNYGVKENCWIKANPNFEGLKQILYEPEARVKIQTPEPDLKDEKLVIDEVKYTSSDNLFTPYSIKFNKNLNVIIGGKSSGKSILLYNIASTLETHDEVSSIKKDKYNFREKDADFNFEVTSSSGITQKLHDDSKNSIIPNIKYIPQNYLFQLADPEENKTGGQLLKYVRGLLLEDEDYYSFYHTDFIGAVKTNDRKREDLIDDFFELRDRIKDLEKQIKEKGSSEVLEGSIKANTEKIGELKKGGGLTDEQIALYNKKKKEIEALQAERTRVISDFKKISTFHNDSLHTLKDLRKKKELTQSTIETEGLRDLFIEKYDFLDEAINDIESLIELYRVEEKRFVNDNEFKTLLSENTGKKLLLEEEIKPLIQNISLRDQVSKLEKIVDVDKQKLNAIRELSINIEQLKDDLLKVKEALFALYKDNRTEYDKVIEKLSERTALLNEKHLEIQGVEKFNKRKFKASILDISDGRSFPSEMYDLFKKGVGLIDFNEGHFKEIEMLFDQILDGTFKLSSKTKIKTAIKILLDDYFVDHWDTKYYGDRMGEMSVGKASFVILMLIVGLSNSKAPILIDQPEDNLDNRSITTDLVEYLRNKKVERQIILVTHNPNVVVNADAENIIVAHQKGQSDKKTSSEYDFDYVNGAIENSFINESETDLLKTMGIKEHIAEIVEGGKIAFQKRERKYGFSK